MPETAEFGKRLRDLEALAFRTGRPITGNDDLRATADKEQHTDSGSINSRAIEWRLDAVERVLFALARAQGIDPAATD